MNIDNFITGLYMLVILVTGMWYSKNVKSLKDFATSDKKYGAFIVFATLSASYIGGGFSTGNASKVFTFGICNIVALWGFSLKEILVAKFIVPKMDRFPDALSAGDLMGRIYGKFAQVTTGVFSILLCAGILGAQVGAMGYIFNVMTGLPAMWGIILGVGSVIIYSTAGGMRAVIITDIIQFCVLAAGIPLVVFFGLMKAGGIESVMNNIPANHLTLFGNMSFIPFLSLFLTLLLGETLVPPYVQRLFIGKDFKRTARGTFWSGIFSIPFFALSGCIGLIALSMDSGIDPNISLPFVTIESTPIIIKGIVVAALLSIVMSSADSFLNSAATSFVEDILMQLPQKETKDSTIMFWARATNLVTGIIAVIIALKIPNVLDILFFAYNFWAPVILVPLAAAILMRQVSFPAFLAGMLSGVAGVIIWSYILHNPGGFDGLIFGVLSNAVVFFLVNHFTRKNPKKNQVLE